MILAAWNNSSDFDAVVVEKCNNNNDNIDDDDDVGNGSAADGSGGCWCCNDDRIPLAADTGAWWANDVVAFPSLFFYFDSDEFNMLYTRWWQDWDMGVVRYCCCW